MEYLEALEASGFSMWVKESSTAYVVVLAFHTIGLTFLVGISSAAAMRILGVGRGIPLAAMLDFFPLMYVGLLINALTGAVLMCLYPTDYLVDDFTIYIKLVAVIFALVFLQKIKRGIEQVRDSQDESALPESAKKMSIALIFFWLVAVLAGRVAAYSLPTKLETAGAVIVFLGLAAVVGYLFGNKLGLIDSDEQSS